MKTFEAYIADFFYLKSRGYVISCQINQGKVKIGDELEVIPKTGSVVQTKVIGIPIGRSCPIKDGLIDLLVSLPVEFETNLTGATVRILANT